MTTETAAKSSESSSSSKKMTGVVTWVNVEERLGFIKPDEPIEGLEVNPKFLATNLTTGLLLETLSEGDRVEFIIENVIGREGRVIKSVKQICLLSKASVRAEHFWNGLKMRSKAEIKIAEELEKSGVLFLPNCKARLSTPGINLEPDFIVCCEGKWGILEVDGPHHTIEARVDEQKRERHFKHYRIFIVERFTADYCLSRPDKVVEEFLKLLRST
ncbi:MAG: cold shock domain-containing protein [Stenomitos frigidus ULC029]